MTILWGILYLLVGFTFCVLSEFVDYKLRKGVQKDLDDFDYALLSLCCVFWPIFLVLVLVYFLFLGSGLLIETCAAYLYKRFK